MTTLLLAMLGWVLASGVMAAFWAAVMAGARAGAVRNAPATAHRETASDDEAARVPAPRAAAVGQVVAA